jgi:hypothetical protein
MLACSGVTLGRRFGRDCLKYEKRPFIAVDSLVLAFLVGPRAATLLDSYPTTRLWNPRNGRTPKLSWICCTPNHPHTLSVLTLAAYDWVQERADEKTVRANAMATIPVQSSLPEQRASLTDEC